MVMIVTCLTNGDKYVHQSKIPLGHLAVSEDSKCYMWFLDGGYAIHINSHPNRSTHLMIRTHMTENYKDLGEFTMKVKE